MKVELPMISVCMITYNHGSFIRQAIEGVLAQKTNFRYKLFIADDCSSDDTRKICHSFADKFPEIIELTTNTKNIGMMPNFINALRACDGKYIALCEGDDYWTDPLKLQKQVDFLEQNSGYVICLHNSYLKFEGSAQPDKVAIPAPKEDLTLEDFINIDYFRKKKGLISRGHTSSVVFKNHIIKEFPDWYCHKAIAGDIYLLMLLAQHGKGRFINEFMSVYRINLGGVTRASSAQKGHLLHENRILMLNILNKHFQYRYNELITSQIVEFYLAEAKLYGKENKHSKVIEHLSLAVKYGNNKLEILKKGMRLAGEVYEPIGIFFRGVRKIKGVLTG